jgi:hypothetical protein
MWILIEDTNAYILKCSHCEASGNYHTAQQGLHADDVDAATSPDSSHADNSSAQKYSA